MGAFAKLRALKANLENKIESKLGIVDELTLDPERYNEVQNWFDEYETSANESQISYDA